MFYYQTTSIIVYILFLLLAMLAVGLRFFARRITRISLGIDDWLAFIALVINIGVSIYEIVCMYTVDYEDLLTKVDPHQHLKSGYIDAILTTAVTGIIKCSVILFYKRIFETRTFRIVANIVLAINIATVTAGTLATIFHSYPISNYWDYDSSNMNFGMMEIFLNVLDLVLDLVVLSLPLAMIRKLHLSKRKRIGVAAIFGLGIICVITISVRLAYFVQVSNLIDNPVAILENPERATVICDAAFLWAHLGCSVSIITACLPMLVPVYTKLKTISSSISPTRLIGKPIKKSASIVPSEQMVLKHSNSNEQKGSLEREPEIEGQHGKIEATTVVSVF